MSIRNIIGVLALLFSATAFAQAKVFVTVTAEDGLGEQLGYQIKENIRSSRGMNLVGSDEDAAVSLRITTLDPNDDRTQTIYSIVWTVSTTYGKGAYFYWTSTVGICGQSRIKLCADRVTAKTDTVITELQEVQRKIMKKSS